MARPTDEKKDIRINLRVSADLGEMIEQEAFEQGISMSEWIRRKLEDSVIQNNPEDGFVIQNSEQPQDDYFRKINNIGLVIGISADDLLDSIQNLIEEDYLYGKNGKLCWNLRKIMSYVENKS